ncbi:MAG: gamma-glutamyltransferase family protein [Candidatus Hydrogenedentes bacterium]|nr:gamma-glutamyltransferase family protein [Candidatus Hydrogenedentota bacterium]
MDRRTFMQLSAAAAALGAGVLGEAGAQETAAGGGMQVNLDIVNNRNQNRSTVACRHGMVCTSQPLASMAGVDILKAGGSAIDAAICANSMLSLVEPMNCGPGGDLFAIVWSEKDQKLFGVNASGRAPYAWNLEDAAKLGLKEIPSYSPLAWNVPGCVSGWDLLHGKFGRKDFAALFAPVIQYAREGFAVSPIISLDWEFKPGSFANLDKTFLVDGHTPRFGEIFTNPDLAAFYEILVRDGLQAYYKGEIAERIVKFSEANEGKFALRDFADHEANWVDPVGTNYRGYDVWEIPPNGQGIAVLQILNILEQFDIGSLQPNSAEHLHLFIEAKKLAYEDRAIYYADPAFADVPTPWLISKDYGKERAKLIDPNKAAQNVQPGQYEAKSETIYLSAADADGNMVSFIQSLYHGWGSHLVPDGLGFPIQNRGESFALDPNHRNKLEPHKRPFHTIIPAFMTTGGRPKFAFGVMGGDFQPQGHSQVAMNMIDFGFSPQQAGEQPRVEHTGSSTQTGDKMRASGSVRLERGFSDELRQKLTDMGHNVSRNIGAFGGYQSIWREEEPLRYFGGSDPRKDGASMGW